MKSIRNSIFETNSSSMHSIVLVDALNKDVQLSDYRYNIITKTYTIHFYVRDDNSSVLTSPEEKIDYLVSQVSVVYDKKSIQKYLNVKTVLNDNLELKVLNVVKKSYYRCF